jgi:hypothetical protein
VFSYGHNSNFVYFTFYGITFDDPSFDSVALVMHFAAPLAHYQLKSSLLHQELTMSKKAKFYHRFSERGPSNLNFLAKCRYYWYDGPTNVLADVSLRHTTPIERVPGTWGPLKTEDADQVPAENCRAREAGAEESGRVR